jgi:hypothetical protein
MRLDMTSSTGFVVSLYELKVLRALVANLWGETGALGKLLIFID